MDQQNAGSKRSASSAAGKVAAKSRDTAEHWKEAVTDQVQDARDRAVSAQAQTSDRIRALAGHIRQLGDNLREDEPLVANVAAGASRRVEDLAHYVEQASPQSIVRDTEQLARRRPELFYGGAFLLGLAASRFIKAARTAGDGQPRSQHEADDDAPLARSNDRPSGFFPPGDVP